MATRILVVDDSPTIRTVVSMILERNGYESKVASDGQDAYEALASGEVKADLVLVDFVMPRMNGYQFCRALRENVELATTPVVLMSAKGDRIRDQFVQQTGALDAITKPFDARALVAVIENALRRVNSVRTSSARLPELESDELTAMTTPHAPVVAEYETRRTHVAQIVAEKLSELTVELLSPRPDSVSGSKLRAELVERLSNEGVLEMLEAIAERGAIVRGALLSGDLGVVPIGAVLQLLQAENQTGVLVCTNDDSMEVRATFRGGAIDLVEASGAGDEFRLGRFFVEEGVLTSSEIDAVTTANRASTEGGADELDAPRSIIQTVSTTGTKLPEEHVVGSIWGARSSSLPSDRRGRPLGMALVEAGKIVESQLRAALTRQSSELLYEVLRWPSGRFELRRESPSELAESAKLGLPVASVVMEGFRRVDEWRVLERTLGSFDAVLVRDDAAFGTFDATSLPLRERAVLAAVDGERSIRAIVVASNLSSFDACRILAQFLEARVLRRRAG